MPSFARDIRPLFREKDVEEMRFAFDLTQYEDVKTNASGMYDRWLDGSMPCDGAWTGGAQRRECEAPEWPTTADGGLIGASN